MLSSSKCEHSFLFLKKSFVPWDYLARHWKQDIYRFCLEKEKPFKFVLCPVLFELLYTQSTTTVCNGKKCTKGDRITHTDYLVGTSHSSGFKICSYPFFQAPCKRIIIFTFGKEESLWQQRDHTSSPSPLPPLLSLLTWHRRKKDSTEKCNPYQFNNFTAGSTFSCWRER